MEQFIIIITTACILFATGLYTLWYIRREEKILSELDAEYKSTNRVDLWEMKDAFIYQDNHKADLKKYRHFIHIKAAADWINSTTKVYMN